MYTKRIRQVYKHCNNISYTDEEGLYITLYLIEYVILSWMNILSIQKGKTIFYIQRYLMSIVRHILCISIYVCLLNFTLCSYTILYYVILDYYLILFGISTILY